MTYTVNNIERDVTSGHRLLVTIDITSLDAAGTEALTLSDLGLNTVHGGAVMGQENAGYHVTYDHSNEAVDVTYADYDAASDGVLINVPAATDVGEVVLELVGY